MAPGVAASNGSRLRLWKTELAEFAAQTGLSITICHLHLLVPGGTVVPDSTQVGR